MSDPKLSIIIPAYNEEKRIASSLREILKYLKKRGEAFEIIVINDCSSDKTVDVVNGISENDNVKVLSNQINKGKGYSVKRGMLEAKGDYLLFSDADLSTPIEELPKLSAALDSGNDVAIGSRALKDSVLEIRQPIYRELMGRTFNTIVRMLLGFNLKDTQCGFKMFKRDAAKKIFEIQQIEGWSFDVEILCIASKLNYKIAEIPVRWINSPASKVSPIKDAINMFLDVIKIRNKYKNLKLSE